MRVTSIDFFDHGKRVPAGTPVSELSNRCRESVEAAGWTCEAKTENASEPNPVPETDSKTETKPQAAQPADQPADDKPAKAEKADASKAKTRGK